MADFNLDDQSNGSTILIDEAAEIDSKVTISLAGQGHRIVVEGCVSLRSMRIFLRGKNHQLIIKENCNLRGEIYLRHNGSSIDIGEATTWVSARCYALEGKAIIIGADCMFSSEIIIRTSDEHPILDDKTGERINRAADVNIGSHVWLGNRVTVGKGASIAPGCVIGAHSIVSGSLNEPNAIYVGVPAKIKRSGIRWQRKLDI